jgi:hypothetical protein
VTYQCLHYTWKHPAIAERAVNPLCLAPPLRHYLPYPGVVFDIQPQAALAQLVQHLEQASAFTGAPPRTHPFSAHMTIAEFITAERTATLIDELQPHTPIGSFPCSRLAYAIPDMHFSFTEQATLQLG